MKDLDGHQWGQLIGGAFVLVIAGLLLSGGLSIRFAAYVLELGAGVCALLLAMRLVRHHKRRGDDDQSNDK